MLVTIIRVVSSLVTTRIGVIAISSCSKPNPRVTGPTVLLVVAKDTNPRFRRTTVTRKNVKPLLVTVGLQ